MEPLAIRLGRQETPAKSLVIPQGDSDFLRPEAREKSYVTQAGEGANVMPHKGTPTFYGLKPMKDRMPKPINDGYSALPVYGWGSFP